MKILFIIMIFLTLNVEAVDTTSKKTDKKKVVPKIALMQKIYNWFNPVIETESNFTQKDAQVKVVGGTVNQKFIGPLTLGLGGKYVNKQDSIQTYMGLGNIRLNLNRMGNLWVHHEYLVKGIEVGEHPQKTVITYSIPTILGMTLSFNKEYRWTEEFKMDISSIGVEKQIGRNTTFNTRHSMQTYTNGVRNDQIMAGFRNTIQLTQRTKLSTSAEVWQNMETQKLEYKIFNSTIEYFSAELSRLSIANYIYMWNHENNPILQLTLLLPIRFGLYVGTRGEVNYHIPKQLEEWCCIKRNAGIVYIPTYTNKFRIVGNIKDNQAPWSNYGIAEAVKIILYPIKSIKTSLKYTFAEDNKLSSAWIKYII
ncbi:MAG: hypothetical protein HY769_03480 [Candidatus Stahlbacteria bacterium]|nr:hypothetical protein [Candidatus Stahlbacteria bacterium]